MLLSSTLTVALAGKFDHPVLTPRTNASFARARQPRYWCCPRPRAFPGATVPKKKTSAHRTPWAKEDVRDLKAHSKARTPLPEIAKKMKRTERALRRKAGILGIGLGHNR
jgi:hypothetical protein